MDYKKEIIEMLDKASKVQLYCIYRLIKAYLD
jgi:hypothetical protein